MSDNRKYYYLNLKESYFDDDAIVLLESMQDGMLYSNILLKLYLKSLKYGGTLQLDENIPYTAQMIATITQEFIERCFRLTANAADELLSIPDRLAELGNVAHDTFHVAARLRAFFVIHEVDDCDLSAPPSCISRRTVLIFANSCTAVSRLANWTFPMFASTASWLRLLPMAFCCRRTSFSPSRMTIHFPRQHAVT